MPEKFFKLDEVTAQEIRSLLHVIKMMAVRQDLLAQDKQEYLKSHAWQALEDHIEGLIIKLEDSEQQG